MLPRIFYAFSNASQTLQSFQASFFAIRIILTSQEKMGERKEHFFNNFFTLGLLLTHKAED